jgi:hypothetical protein
VGVNVIRLNHLSTYTFLAGVAVLFAALFTGHLVTVKSIPAAPPGSGSSGALIAPSYWHATRAQYDPNYRDRILWVDTSAAASSNDGVDWHATRAQYQPGYMIEQGKTVAKKTSSGCGRGAR